VTGIRMPTSELFPRAAPQAFHPHQLLVVRTAHNLGAQQARASAAARLHHICLRPTQQQCHNENRHARHVVRRVATRATHLAHAAGRRVDEP
jgi:hypothetical protein